MFRKFFLLFILLSSATFSIVRDEIAFFSEQEEKKINTRVELLEKQFDIKFQINLLSEELENENLNNLQKTVIINLLKTEDRLLKLNLKFSNDLEVSEYRDDINELLNNLDLLMINGEYQDFIYELTANISDIINLVTIEDKKMKSRLQAIKFLKVSAVFILTLLGIAILIVIVRIQLKNAKRKKNTNFCSNCNVRMRISEKIEKNGKVIKIYECSQCGETKQIIMKKK